MPQTEIKPTAVLVLSDGTVFYGHGFGAIGENTGELCFNTSHTGHQEIMTDPSYAGQIVTFTFPHIGNVGANQDDDESESDISSAVGLIVRNRPTPPSNYRSEESFSDWLQRHNKIGICEIDTRALTLRIRDQGPPTAVIAHDPNGTFDIEALTEKAASVPTLKGVDLAKDVTTDQDQGWNHPLWWHEDDETARQATKKKSHKKSKKIIALDYGCKQNILRYLIDAGCEVTLVNAKTSAAEIIAAKPDGVFLSNGPGDPFATADYAVPVIQELLAAHLPMFGICLGHQLLALAAGAKTKKMELGHRGANHPVKDLTSGQVLITSQNHGFVVDADSLPADLEATHVSLFDGTNQGLRHRERPAFSVQFHPEASPGPHDAAPLFQQFYEMMNA